MWPGSALPAIYLLLAGLWLGDGAQDITPRRVSAARQFVEGSWSRLGLPGVSVSVATADSVVLVEAHGCCAASGGPLEPGTPVRIGSVSKTFTAALTAELASEGVLDLDAPVEDYLPGFSLAPPFRPRSITLRNLLQHRSGLSQWSGHDARAQREGLFDHIRASGAPGGDPEYSSLNFIILGRVLEAATGESYGVLLKRMLLDPLGMGASGAEHGPAAHVAPAAGHQNWFGFPVRFEQPSPPRYLVPAGYVSSSARDMGRYAGMLLAGGEFGGSPVLSVSTVSGLLGPLDTSGYALGWGRRRENGVLFLEHSGNSRASSARVRLVPSEGYAIVVLASTNSGPFFSAVDDMLDGVHKALRGERPSSPWPRERLVKIMILAGTTVSVVGLVRRVMIWNRLGRRIASPATRSAWTRLTLDMLLGAVVLLGVPRLIGVPLGTLAEYFPDLAIALVASAVAGILAGLFRGITPT